MLNFIMTIDIILSVVYIGEVFQGRSYNSGFTCLGYLG